MALESIADILSAGKITADALAWHELGPEHSSALRGRLRELYAPATANRYLSALRGVLKASWRLEYIDRDAMERTLDVQPIRGKRELKGRGLTREELDAVFGGCIDDKNAVAGALDACILGLLYGAGLRRTEVAILDIEDLDFGTGSLKVIGKGDKERTVYLPPGTLQLAESWIAHRGALEPGPLLYGLRELFGSIRRTHSPPGFLGNSVPSTLGVNGYHSGTYRGRPWDPLPCLL